MDNDKHKIRYIVYCTDYDGRYSFANKSFYFFHNAETYAIKLSKSKILKERFEYVIIVSRAYNVIWRKKI